MKSKSPPFSAENVSSEFASARAAKSAPLLSSAFNDSAFAFAAAAAEVYIAGD